MRKTAYARSRKSVRCAEKPTGWAIVHAIIIFVVVCLLIGYWVTSCAQAAGNAEV